jgi:hypothetical protein
LKLFRRSAAVESIRKAACNGKFVKRRQSVTQPPFFIQNRLFVFDIAPFRLVSSGHEIRSPRCRTDKRAFVLVFDRS